MTVPEDPPYVIDVSVGANYRWNCKLCPPSSRAASGLNLAVSYEHACYAAQTHMAVWHGPEDPKPKES